MTGALALRDVTIGLGAEVLVDRLSLEIAPGEVVTVMGPSGAGKSSLLAFVCGTLDPAFSATGTVAVAGEAIERLPPQARRVGILFQDDLLFPHLSVGGNLAFGLSPDIRGRAARAARVEEALVEAELAGFAERDPASLSGGQRARVALMRTLLAAPRALLLDEPFSKLDADLRGRVRRFVFEHARLRGLPMLLVTHDPDDAAAAGGRILSLARGVDPQRAR
jgi:putative thiamine transport system ATP-binding protein